MDWNTKLVTSLNVTYHSSTLVLQTMDPIAKTTFQIQESISNTLEGSVMEPQVWDTFGMEFSSLETLGKVNTAFQEPNFAPVEHNFD